MSSFTPINPSTQPTALMLLADIASQQTAIPVKKSTSSNSVMAESTTKKFLCKIDGCGKSYTDSTGLSKHTKSIHEKLSFSCREPKCGKSYNRLENLNRHITSTHVGARYYCKISDCKKNYSDPSSLAMHIKTNH